MTGVYLPEKKIKKRRLWRRIKLYFLAIFLLIAGSAAAYYWLQLEKPAVVTEKQKPVKEAAGVWCASSCYWFNKDGIVFDAAPRPDGGLIVTVEEVDKDFQFKLGQALFDNKSWLYLKKIIYSPTAKEWGISDWLFNRAKSELTASVKDGTKLFFSLRFDPEANLRALKEFKEKNAIQGASYVDLRVENRIYYQ